MVYLYAALGVVMMTGIMAVVEMGLSLKGQSFILKPLLSDDQANSINDLTAFDNDLMNLLYKENVVTGLDPLGSSKDSAPLIKSSLCSQVLCRINRNQFCLGENPPVGLSPPPSVDSLNGINESGTSPSGEWWSDSCALELGGKYRFLIRPDSEIDKNFPYQLYSCSLKYDGLNSNPSKCDVEAGP